MGVKHVRTVQEAVQHVQHVRDTLRSELDHPGGGLGHGRCLVMMPRLQGSEHDVDVVLFQGHLMAAFVSDNGPTHLPLCAETAATMPSVLQKGQSPCPPCSTKVSPPAPRAPQRSAPVLHKGQSTCTPCSTKVSPPAPRAPLRSVHLPPVLHKGQSIFPPCSTKVSPHSPCSTKVSQRSPCSTKISPHSPCSTKVSP